MRTRGPVASALVQEQGCKNRRGATAMPMTLQLVPYFTEKGLSFDEAIEALQNVFQLDMNRDLLLSQFEWAFALGCSGTGAC
jgi:hypothetical protein